LTWARNDPGGGGGWGIAFSLVRPTMRRMSALSTISETLVLESAALRSPWAMARRRFRRNIFAVAGMVVLALVLGACFSSLPWTLNNYNDQHDLLHVFEEPSWQFVFGTDSLSRDILTRFLLGGTISLAIGLAAALISVVIGTSVGLLSGYVGGRVDAFLMRLVDILYGLPYILLVILMRVVLVPIFTKFLQQLTNNPESSAVAAWANILVLLVGIASVSWLTMARVVRGQVLSLREQPFIEACRALGYTNPRILLQHILPNLVGPILVYATLTVPQAILSESFLSFLGLGIQAPLPSWGNMASEGIDALNPVQVRWWLILWPCLGLSVTLLCLNFVGDGLRDALDPKSSR